jgi:hypothetical protein
MAFFRSLSSAGAILNPLFTPSLGPFSRIPSFKCDRQLRQAGFQPRPGRPI